MNDTHKKKSIVDATCTVQTTGTGTSTVGSTDEKYPVRYDTHIYDANGTYVLQY